MSEYTTEEILKLIEENGGPEGLDLVGSDLSNLDLHGMDLHGIVLSRWDIESNSCMAANLQGANLARANLQAGDLTHANLQGANLWGANLQGAELFAANLQGANLEGANLQEASLELANLEEARLNDANLQRAMLGGANLQRANLFEANLQGAMLGGANLEGAKLLFANLQVIDLVRANLQGAELFAANLQGVALEEVNLQGADLQFADLREADLLDVERGGLLGVRFYRARLDHTALRRDQLGSAIGDEQVGEYREAQDAYLALKRNFEDLGDYEAASWSYIKERQMEKACSAPGRARRFYGESQLGDVWTWDKEEQARKWESGLPTRHPRVLWFYTRHTLKWLADWFVELLCGYGESLWRVLVWMLLVILGFAAYYQATQAVVTSSQEAATSRWDHLIFSLGAFTTLQPARLQAARPGVELLTTVQAIIGISLAGLVGFVAGNRIRRS